MANIGDCEAIPPLVHRMQVAYTEGMVAPSEHAISESSLKPMLFVNALQESQRPIEIISPEPLKREDFCRVHSPDFVDAVLELQQDNGFGNRSPRIALTLPWTSGSLYTASILALQDGIALSPTSGFHHAGYAKAWGFCTFNGLLIAATRLVSEGRATKVAIVDADFHFGDGTDNIIQRLQLQPRVYHYSFGAEFSRRHAGAAREYLNKLSSLEGPLRLFDPDLIMYQAGADPHERDPLGGILSTPDLERRDQLMFEMAFRLRIPIVWNLAGGYQRDDAGSISPVIQIHLNTFDAAMAVFGP